MDDATRAELAELRRRAFGPEPDIAGDAAAVDRLVALESLVLSEHAALASARVAASVSTGDDFATPPFADDDPIGLDHAAHIATHPPMGEGMPQPAALAETDDDRPRTGGWSRLRGGAGAALVAALAATVVVGMTALTPPFLAADARVAVETTREAFALTRDRDAATLLRIPLNGWFGVDVDLPDDEIPTFPTTGTIDWASPLGEYYGWDLWIGGASDALQNEQCILVLRGSEAKGRCVVAALRGQSALVVSLPYADIEADERPEGFGPGQRIGFWWAFDPHVTVLLSTEPPES